MYYFLFIKKTASRGALMLAMAAGLIMPVFFGGGQINYAAAETVPGTPYLLSEKATPSQKFAPGDFLPVSVKLVNFGSQKRVDVIVDYKIVFDEEDQQVYQISETVAVETTASFVKKITLPSGLKPGQYSLVTVLTYPDQEDPAISRFSFKIESRFFGFFASDLLYYGLWIVLALAMAVGVTYWFTRSKKNPRTVALHNYSNHPREEMIYYEIINDIVFEMRMHIGDKAIILAQEVEGLKINPKNAYIQQLEGSPAKIVSSLIVKYEQYLGRPINFSLRKP